MSYAFAPYQPSVIGRVDRMDIPINRWMGLKFEEEAYHTALGAWDRFTQDLGWSGGPTLSIAEANKEYGIPGYLEFKERTEIQRARLMRERKDAELVRMTYLNAATHSAFSGKAAMGLLAGMAGGVSNPLDFSLMLIPFVGTSTKAAGVARLGARAVTLTERGLLGGSFRPFSAAVINGTIGNAVTEIPVFIQNVRDQAIYGPEDAAANVLLGGATGGLFHLGGVGLKKLLGLAAKAHARMTGETAGLSAREAINNAVNGDVTASDRIARADRNVIAHDLVLAEAQLRAKAERLFMREAGTEQAASANELLQLASAEAQRGSPAGKILARLVERFEGGERTPDVFDNMAALLDRVYDPTRIEAQKSFTVESFFGARRKALEPVTKKLEAHKTELQTERERIEPVLQDLFKRKQLEAPAPKGLAVDPFTFNIIKLQTRLAEITADLERINKLLDLQGPLTVAELRAHSEGRAAAPELDAKIDAVRDQRIKEYVAAEMEKLKASLENKADIDYKSQLQDELKRGKVLSDEQVKELSSKQADAETIALLKQNIANLEQELKAPAPVEGAPVNPVDEVIGKLVVAETAKFEAVADDVTFTAVRNGKEVQVETSYRKAKQDLNEKLAKTTDVSDKASIREQLESIERQHEQNQTLVQTDSDKAIDTALDCLTRNLT